MARDKNKLIIQKCLSWNGFNSEWAFQNICLDHSNAEDLAWDVWEQARKELLRELKLYGNIVCNCNNIDGQCFYCSEIYNNINEK